MISSAPPSSNYSSFSSLPSEVVDYCLSYLSHTSYPSTRLTCHSWTNIIDSAWINPSLKLLRIYQTYRSPIEGPSIIQFFAPIARLRMPLGNDDIC